MQLTIDSREPLDDVLRAVGSLYNVSLTTAADTQTDGTGSPSGGRRVDGRRSTDGRTRRPRGSSTKLNPKEVRAWAAENGFEVGSRGAIPAAARDAYAAAH